MFYFKDKPREENSYESPSPTDIKDRTGANWPIGGHLEKNTQNSVLTFVRQLSVDNVRVLIFVSVTPLYSSDGPFSVAAVGFSFPKIDAQSSPIFEISA